MHKDELKTVKLSEALELLEDSLQALDLLFTTESIQIIGGYAVRPTKISELRPAQMQGIKATLYGVRRIHLPRVLYYKCPHCGAEYTRSFSYFLAIAEFIEKRGKYISHRCPACGLTAYVVPHKSQFIDAYYAVAYDGSGSVPVVIKHDIFQPIMRGEFTGIYLTYGGAKHIFVVTGVESIHTRHINSYIDVAKLVVGADASSFVNLLASLVKPDANSYLTTVIVVRNLASFSLYVKIARYVGAKVGRGPNTRAEPYTPYIFIADNARRLIYAATHNGPNNIVIATTDQQLVRTIDADLTVRLYSNIRIVDIEPIVNTVIRAIASQPPADCQSNLCKSVKKVLPDAIVKPLVDI